MGTEKDLSEVSMYPFQPKPRGDQHNRHPGWMSRGSIWSQALTVSLSVVAINTLTSLTLDIEIFRIYLLQRTLRHSGHPLEL